ncbi:hypothetical protein JMF94_01175 [Desulfovibrio sp. UIB00]|uniref:hypothetical protein n=1 Tax=Desulfovibrio sp. UIB00 TaxID=2804314 RepID=UPI001F0FAC65|nr:hypothetical protein [Desulfovibrio sp. UIB00]MCH5143690.1 hypothetical protein [Desulfovibrio sp. UIB00]
MKLFDKLVQIKDSVVDTTTSTKDIAVDASASAKEKIHKSTKDAFEYFSSVDLNKYKDIEYKNYIKNKYCDFSESVVEKFNATFELDKDAEQLVNDMKEARHGCPQNASEIFELCKNEALQRTIAVFCLGPIFNNLDDTLENRYSKLSTPYKDYAKVKDVRRHKNFAKLGKIRDRAKENMEVLDNGYNADKALYPWEAQIEHIISAKEYHSNVILKAGTNESEYISAINDKDNLTFIDGIVNSAKGELDLIEFVKSNINFEIDENDPDIYNYIDKNGDKHSINMNDVKDRYGEANAAYMHNTINAAKEIGRTAVESGLKMSMQQIVGLIVYETVDIFVDEIKDISETCDIFDKKSYKENISKRASSISKKLKKRFDERDLLNRAKTLGIESTISGALSVIPQIIIAIIIKMPAFLIAIIRESTLSMVRCVRILTSKIDNKFDAIKIVFAGTASAILGVYIQKVISSSIAAIPIINRFNRQVTEVLSGMLTVAIPLSAVYLFEINKNKFSFSFKGNTGLSE